MLSYVDAFQSSSKDSSFTTGNIPLFAQCLLMSLLMFILTKQIPQMVQGLLSGSPQLTGASMTSIAKQGMNAGAKAGAAVASGGASVAGAAMHGAAAGAGFKAAGGGGSLAKLGGALKGGLNGAAGAMAQGTAGLAKNAILGSNNNNAGASGGGGAMGGRSGGLGIVNAMRQGAQLGKNFSTKNQDGEHMGLFGMSDGKGGKTPSVMGNFKDSIKDAISKPETKDVVDMKTTMAKDANGKDVQVQTPQYNADGSMKTHKEKTGQYSGIYGAFQNLGKTYRGAKQSSQSDKSTKEI